MRVLLTGFVGLFVLLIFFSCQKEASLEFGTPAKGSLQGNGGACLPKNVAGSYIAGKALNDSNFLEVTVDVLVPGPYTIETISVNGFSFKGTGTFSSIGATTVRLKATGTPTNAGTSNFSIAFDSTSCDVAVTVLPAGTATVPATFTLDGTPGGCAAFNLAGNYYKDSTLDARHNIKLNVNVTAVGTYSITTAPINGYSFSASSTFGAVGPTQVTLQATGKPVAAGTDNFTVTAGTQTCTFPVTVTVFTPPAGGCNPNVQGTFTAGTATTAANKVTLTHTYTAAGSYNVSVATVNGISFGTQSVVATIPGPNTITLTASGTPAAAGTNTFTVNFGDGQTCTFPVTVNPGAPVVNTDYFPLSPSSFWTYTFPFSAPADTIKKINNGSASIGGTSYRSFEVFNNSGASAYEEFFRKTGNDYFEYILGDYYTLISFDGDVEGALLFLKEGLTTNQTWTSSEFSGTVSGAPMKVRYQFKCIDANATVTVNSKTYSNVYKVTMQSETSPNGTTWTAENLLWETWYAKGIGMVQQKVTSGSTTITSGIRFYQVL